MLLPSQMGPQRGDPLGPLLFSLPLQPVLHSLESVLRVGFLDDLILGGEIGAETRDVDILSGLGLKLGLCLNPSKCEVLAPGFLGEVLPGLSVRLSKGGDVYLYFARGPTLPRCCSGRVFWVINARFIAGPWIECEGCQHRMP